MAKISEKFPISDLNSKSEKCVSCTLFDVANILLTCGLALLAAPSVLSTDKIFLRPKSFAKFVECEKLSC